MSVEVDAATPTPKRRKGAQQPNRSLCGLPRVGGGIVLRSASFAEKDFDPLDSDALSFRDRACSSTIPTTKRERSEPLSLEPHDRDSVRRSRHKYQKKKGGASKNKKQT